MSLLFFFGAVFFRFPGPRGAKAAIQCRCTWTNLSMFQVGQWGQVMKVAQVHQEAGHWNISGVPEITRKKTLHNTKAAFFSPVSVLERTPIYSFDNGPAQGGPNLRHSSHSRPDFPWTKLERSVRIDDRPESKRLMYRLLTSIAG